MMNSPDNSDRSSLPRPISESEGSRRERIPVEHPSFDIITYTRNAIARIFLLDLDRIFSENFDWLEKGIEEQREQITSPTTDISILASAMGKLLNTGQPVVVDSEFSTDAIRKAFAKIGLSHGQLSHVTTIGKEQRGNLHKSDPASIETVANHLGISTANMMLFSDENLPRLEPMISAGISIVSIGKAEGLAQAVHIILDPSAYQEVSYEDVAHSLYTTGKIRVIGLTGRAGTGKSTIAQRLAKAVKNIGGKAEAIDLDSFFYMSSRERRAWVNESVISDEERRLRRNMTNWVNYTLVNETFARIHAGEHIHLEDMYSMALGGEKVGVLDFDPDPTGFTVILGGTALLDARLKSDLDTVVYINTHETVRRSAIWERDRLRGYSREAYEERFKLTQQSETEDCLSQTQRIQIFK